jgi:tRNA-dihydrouridine synthase B
MGTSSRTSRDRPVPDHLATMVFQLSTDSMNPPHPSPPFLYLAPLQGVTDAVYRRVFHRQFGGFDAAMAPFINPQRHCVAKEKWFADVLPENNPDLPVIPQLLNTDAEDLIALAARLQDLGYEHINWNLGCPVPMIARKKRGSGLLPYPETIVALLEEIVPRIKARLSIKTRLGYHAPEEILTLLPMLEAFPLQEIILHARLGSQLYAGRVDLEGFARCLSVTSHTLVYNGDITSAAVFRDLQERFPQINRWMIGRGVLADPFLIGAIRGNPFPEEDRPTKLADFHEDLYQEYSRRLSGPGHLLGRMKQLWLYLIASFPEKQRLLKKIKRAHTVQQYRLAVDEILSR